MTAILDTDIDFDGTVTEDALDPTFDAWFESMISDSDEGEYTDPEDADWNENIFEDEDEDAEVALAVVIAAPAKERDAKKCRAWAQEQGLSVGSRGVIATEVWDAYLAS